MKRLTIHTVTMIRRPCSGLILLLLAGCASWPDAGQGGDIQVDTSRQYYLDQIDDWIGIRPETKGALATQWSIHNLKLDSLILRGARECIPARVREVVRISQRARRELDGQLLEDARNTLVIMQRETDELERRLLYIKRHTSCPANVRLSGDADHGAFRYRYARYQLKALLNQDHAFATDSDQLTPLYSEQLAVASRYLKAFPQLRLRLNGHTDSRASYDHNQELSLRRARQVKQHLLALGIAEERMLIRAFGEHLPRASNATPGGRLLNRRVHIEVLEPQPTLDTLYLEMDARAGFSPSSETSRSVKHWPVSNDEFSYSYFDDFQQRRLAPGE